MTQKLSVPEHRNTAQRDIESRQSDNQGERVDYRRLAWVAPLTAVAASISTAAVGFVEGVLGLLPQDIALFQPGSIAIGTCVQVVAAIVVFALIGVIARRPVATFRIVALAALVLSFLNPIAAGLGAMPGLSISPATVLALLVLHLVAGGITIGLLTRQARAP